MLLLTIARSVHKISCRSHDYLKVAVITRELSVALLVAEWNSWTADVTRVRNHYVEVTCSVGLQFVMSQLTLKSKSVNRSLALQLSLPFHDLRWIMCMGVIKKNYPLLLTSWTWNEIRTCFLYFKRSVSKRISRLSDVYKVPLNWRHFKFGEIFCCYVSRVASGDSITEDYRSQALDAAILQVNWGEWTWSSKVVSLQGLETSLCPNNSTLIKFSS